MMVAPKLRFKADDGCDFPDWEDKTLGELFHISAGGDIDKNNCAAKQSEDYPYPVYANALVNNGTYGYANYYKIDGDTFTVTGRGDVGHAVARHCMYVPIVRLLVCQPNMDDDVDFFAEQINHTRVFIESTGVPQLTAPQLSKIKVRRPTLPEQRKIADLLSAVDAVIAAQQAEVDAWEQRKKGVMQKLFSQEVRFKADDGSEFPKWEEKTLGEEGQFYGGLSGKGKDDFDCGNGRFVTYMNVYKNTFASRDAMGRVKVGDAEKQNKVRYGDILFTQSSETVDEVGLSSVYLYNDEPYLNSFCMGYRFNNLDNVCPEFIGYCMRSNEIRKSIMLMGQGISRINLGAKRLATVKWLFPFECVRAVLHHLLCE
ncbi:type IC HsdS subunit [Bifidobacterium pseudolongum subsp. pseudolongum]|uniref:Type IC HsdS subunit n=1 Tax=Bifidobacterium pseudolongum subsp. pseudolongum TaxID=31954 RepID=A0A4Q5A717_9BIFI|nr:restriction endonuclease subunit S [Bifidobacterium pseudolongum]RYQ19171.1 type IC HsdS subunit [Bifidobacterium pseudolongum subsp. pseudolongum]